MKLHAPESYWRASQELKDEVCNGCGSSDAKFDFVPDTIWGLSIVEACNPHDWMYHIGSTLHEKEEADRVFLNNMLRLIENDNSFFGKLLKMPRRRRALKYYEAVNRFGGPSFWAGKNEPSEEEGFFRNS